MRLSVDHAAVAGPQRAPNVCGSFCKSMYISLAIPQYPPRLPHYWFVARSPEKFGFREQCCCCRQRSVQLYYLKLRCAWIYLHKAPHVLPRHRFGSQLHEVQADPAGRPFLRGIMGISVALVFAFPLCRVKHRRRSCYCWAVVVVFGRKDSNRDWQSRFFLCP